MAWFNRVKNITEIRRRLDYFGLEQGSGASCIENVHEVSGSLQSEWFLRNATTPFKCLHTKLVKTEHKKPWTGARDRSNKSIMPSIATYLNHFDISNCHAPAAQQISMTRRCTGIIVCSTRFHLHDWNRLAMGHSCIGYLNSKSMTTGESYRHQFGNLSRRTRIHRVDIPWQTQHTSYKTKEMLLLRTVNKKFSESLLCTTLSNQLPFPPLEVFAYKFHLFTLLVIVPHTQCI